MKPRPSMATALLGFLSIQSAAPEANAFLSQREGCRQLRSATSLAPRGMAAKGMGMRVSKAKGKTSSAAKGLKKVKKNGKQQPFNVNASLLRLEKKYDELIKAAAKNLLKQYDEESDVVTTEYVVAARAQGYVEDWVPIAQICLARPSTLAFDGVSDPLVQAAISCYCRELSLVASLGSRVFTSVPRSLLQYAVETSDSFQKHVLAVEDHPPAAHMEHAMSKRDARKVLQLEGDNHDKSEIKQSYRKLSFALHPDRFVGAKRSEADIQVAIEQYARIQLAYETLSSGVRNGGDCSWYQSLGGRARTDFVGPIELKPQEMLPAAVESAVVGLEPDFVQSFVTRSRQQ